MSVHPSSEKLEQLETLLPYLRDVADIVCGSDEIHEESIRLLLTGSELNDEACLRELTQWAAILLSVKVATDVEERVAVAELMSRGVPEASALLAVNKVAQLTQSRSIPIEVSSTLLYFGVLAPDQSAQTFLRVQGGPGRVRVNSDLVKVDPKRFGPGETTLTITVTGNCSESILWGNIFLESKSEKVKVDIVAHWKEQTSKSNTADTFVLEPSGGDDYKILREVIEISHPETTIILSAGVYRLSAPLTLSKSITLIGAGKDETRIVGEAEGYLVKFLGEGVFKAKQIAFIHEGEKWANVVVIEMGDVEFIDCRFEGGVWNAQAKRGGSGLWFQGNAKGRVQSCVFTKNELNGIEVSMQAQPRLEGNTCEGNKQSGIAYFGTAAGEALSNNCRENERNGIYVGERAQPRLEGNTCEGNKQSGIAYLGSSAGCAYSNTCCENQLHGIYVGKQAQPRLKGNICKRNKQCGIAYLGSSAGYAYSNTCCENQLHGIYVGKQAQPILMENVCQDNLQGNIYKER